MPFVAEFRDPWTGNPFVSWNTWVHHRLEVRLEAQVTNSASVVVMNTPVARQQLLDMSGLPAEKVRVLTNGFDPAEYPTAESPRGGPGLESAVLNLAHIGTMYGLGHAPTRNWKGRLADWFDQVGSYSRAPIDPLARSPYYLFSALQILEREDPSLANRMQFHQVGSVGSDPADFTRLTSEFGLRTTCRHTERVDRDQALAYEHEADVLVLTQLRPGDGSACPAVAAKTYGALASGKPMLGLVPPGDMRDLLEQSGRASIAAPDAPDEIAEALRLLLSGEHRRTADIQIGLDLAPFSWEHITDEMRSLLQAVTEG